MVSQNTLIGFVCLFAIAQYLDFERNGRFTLTGTVLSLFFAPIVIVHHLIDRTSKKSDCRACNL